MRMPASESPMQQVEEAHDVTADEMLVEACSASLGNRFPGGDKPDLLPRTVALVFDIWWLLSSLASFALFCFSRFSRIVHESVADG